MHRRPRGIGLYAATSVVWVDGRGIHGQWIQPGASLITASGRPQPLECGDPVAHFLSWSPGNKVLRSLVKEPVAGTPCLPFPTQAFQAQVVLTRTDVSWSAATVWGSSGSIERGDRL